MIWRQKASRRLLLGLLEVSAWPWGNLWQIFVKFPDRAGRGDAGLSQPALNWRVTLRQGRRLLQKSEVIDRQIFAIKKLSDGMLVKFHLELSDA